MKKTIFGLGGIHLAIIGLVILFGGATFFAKHNLPNQATNTSGVYCSSDGTLSDTMPIQSHRSYCLKSDSTGKTYSINTLNEYSFSIIDDQGNTVKDFAITHTKPMHFIVVRKDLMHFQHIHPEYDSSTGLFTIKDLEFPENGIYRVFADFATNSAMKDSVGMPLEITLSEDIKVGGDYTKQPLGSEENKKTFNGIEFTLIPTPTPLVSGKESLLTFNLKRNGQPVSDMEQYLGAFGHSIVFSEDSLDFIHAHPMTRKTPHGTLEFMLTFPEAGKYKVFTQFKRNGKVFTTDFVITVTQGTSMDTSAPGMLH
ncbi:hypothetical protein H0W91_03860 [Patescibacteria group bacterium]|nr:hypothetical protein [Patescibacteria group bacterium]